MANDYSGLIAKLPKNVWLSSAALDSAWKTVGYQRKSRVKQLVGKGLLLRKGHTGSTMYKVADTKNTAPAPASPGSLDELINAVTKIGTENELLKKGLIDIQTIVARTLLTL